jgi:23S rRNA pseudouridine2605 synthase
MSDAEPKGGERLQKILARAGVAPSRRKAEELIEEGRVTINGQVAGLGDRADAETDAIKVDGKRVTSPRSRTYLLLNKPKGVLTSVSDPEGRPTVIDLIPPQFRKALVPVGRLDFMTEGLLILTDDGELAQHLSHPRFGCHKTYSVKVSGEPAERELDKLREGFVLDGHRTAPSRIERSRPPGGTREGDNAWFQVELGEGRSRQIREMFERIGHPVQKLRRVAIGPLRDAELPVGAVRELSEDEVEKLRRATAKPRTKEETARSLAKRPAKALPKFAARAAAKAAAEDRTPKPSRVVEPVAAAKRRGPAGGQLVATRFTEVRKWRDAAPAAAAPPAAPGRPFAGDRARERRPPFGARPERPKFEGGATRPERPSFEKRGPRAGGFERPAAPGRKPARSRAFDDAAPPKRSFAGGDRERTPPKFDRERPAAPDRSEQRGGRPDAKPRFGGERKPFAAKRPPSREGSGRPASERSSSRPPSRPSSRPTSRPFPERREAREGRSFERPSGDRAERPKKPFAGKSSFARSADGPRPSKSFAKPFSRPRDGEAGRAGASRPSGPRPSGSRPAGPRPTGSRPGGPRPTGPRPTGSRPTGSRPVSSRPGSSRPAGARPSGPRPPGSRPGGSRPGGSRPGGPRPGGSRPGGSRPGGSRSGPSRGPRRPSR